MRHTVVPLNDIVLSDGVFLGKGTVVEVEISEKDYAFIAPFILEVRENEKPKTDEKIKTKKARKKNELD